MENFPWCLLRLSLVGLTFLVVAPGHAAPLGVEEAAEEYDEVCREVASDAQPPRDAYISALDVSGDGHLDYVIDTHALGCSVHCGSAGCAIEFWAGDARGVTRVHTSDAYGWSVSQLDGQRRFVLDVHGSLCGKVGAVSCRTILTYDGGWTEETK